MFVLEHDLSMPTLLVGKLSSLLTNLVYSRLAVASCFSCFSLACGPVEQPFYVPAEQYRGGAQKRIMELL